MKKLLICLYAIVLLFGLVGLANAQSIEVDPLSLSLDFGDVVLGEELTAIITITSGEMLPLTVESLSIEDDPTSSFYFVSDPPPPSITLPMGDSLAVTLGFSPSSLGLHAASIRIDSDSEPPDDLLYISLEGSGVPVPEPATILLIGTGLVGFAVPRIRKKFKK